MRLSDIGQRVGMFAHHLGGTAFSLPWAWLSAALRARGL